MTIYEEVKNKLELHPEFRERRLRSKYLAILALRACGYEGRWKAGLMSLNDMAEFGIKFDSYRHAWGDVTRECKELRGSDYDDGEALAQEHVLNLGYEVGYEENVKKLAKIK